MFCNRWITNHNEVHPYHRILNSIYKGTNHGYIKLRWISGELGWVRKTAIPQSLLISESIYIMIVKLKIVKSVEMVNRLMALGLAKGVRGRFSEVSMTIKGYHEDLWRSRKCFVSCLCQNILIVTFYCSFARWNLFCWGKLGKRFVESIISYHHVGIDHYLKIKPFI